ncbi:MAG: hypothetical protein AAF517_17570 [Planctomycetota bacterium]
MRSASSPSAKIPSFALCALVLTLSVAGETLAQNVNFRRGDANQDELLDIADGVTILSTLFLGDAIGCSDAADPNDDGSMNVSDAVYILRHLFLAGPPPIAPYPDCGPDSTEDNLSCNESDICQVETPLCLDDSLLGDQLGPLPGFSFCLPAGLLDIPLDGLEVSVCPEEEAQECDLVEAGCPVDLGEITPFVDVEGRRVGFAIEGRIEDFPISVTEDLFGSTTVCEMDIGGEEDGSPFRIEFFLPLLVETNEDGLEEVVGVGAAEIERTDMSLSASGGIVCVLFSAGQDVFFELLLAPIEQVLAEATGAIEELSIGLVLCPEDK